MVAKSDLLRTIKCFLFLIKLKIFKSSVVTFFELSTTNKTKSASLIACLDLPTPIFSILFLVSLIPAVSIKFNVIPSIITECSIVSLVVPERFETIALSWFNNAFNNEDFPVFGLPTIATLIPFMIGKTRVELFTNLLKNKLISFSLFSIWLLLMSGTSSNSG